jgi:hypothetical protein
MNRVARRWRAPGWVFIGSAYALSERFGLRRPNPHIRPASRGARTAYFWLSVISWTADISLSEIFPLKKQRRVICFCISVSKTVAHIQRCGMPAFAEVGIGLSRKLVFSFADNRQVDPVLANEILDGGPRRGGCKPVAAAKPCRRLPQ